MNGLFKVMRRETGEIFTVYDVRGENSYPEVSAGFLIFDWTTDEYKDANTKEFRYVNSSDYVPLEGDL